MKKYINIWLLVAAMFMTGCGGGSSSSNFGNAEVNSSYAYITDGSSMKVVDITDPSTPVLKGSLTTASSFKVAVAGKYAYVSEFGVSDPYVDIVNIENPANPTLEAAIPKGTVFGRVSDMYIENNVGYVSDEYRGIHIVALGNGIFDPQALDGADAMAVTKIDSALYLIHQGSVFGVQKFDVTTPYVLASTSTINITDVNAFSYPMNTGSTDTFHSLMENDGTDIIVANVQDSKLKKVSGSSLGLLGEVDIGGYATGLAVSGHYAFVTMHNGDVNPLTSGEDAVKMIDLNSMTIVATAALSQASGVAVSEDNLYVTDSTGLHIYDVSAGGMSLLVDFAGGAGNALALGK